MFLLGLGLPRFMANDGGNFGRAMAYGLEIAVGVGLGYVIGSWIDRRFRTEPWGLLVSIAIGFAAGMYLLVKDSVRNEK
jgi:F0F1-type ATP synthase assembly protein I